MSADSTAVERGPSTLASLIAGSAGGAAQVITGQPLDTIKMRAQSAPRGQFSGAMDIFRQTVAKEGFLALYKGMAAPLFAVSAVNSVLFGAFGLAKKWISPYGQLSVMQTALAGSIAGAANSLPCAPVELLKIRMQGQYGAPDDKKLRAVISELYAQGGVRYGLMRGFWVTVAREVPACFGFYGCYTFVKEQFQHRIGHDKKLPLWSVLTAGGAGGIGYWTACYPLDVVKTRVQMRGSGPLGWDYIPRTMRTIYREEGLNAFFRGIGPTYLRTIPAAAATFAAFELTIDLLRDTSVY